MFKKGRIAAIIVIALILSVTTYAFAAANTVDISAAGDGSGAITGFTITGIAYSVDSSNNITGVSFSAKPDAILPNSTLVHFNIQITPDVAGTQKCTATATFSGQTAQTVSCTSASLGTVANATSLKVVAYQ
jgi:hypothetical protein